MFATVEKWRARAVACAIWSVGLGLGARKTKKSRVATPSTQTMMVSQSASRNKNFTFFQNHSAEAVKIKKGDPGYAQPVGLTKQRGDKAKKHIYEVSKTNSFILRTHFHQFRNENFYIVGQIVDFLLRNGKRLFRHQSYKLFFLN